jgi:hypothetical protein
MKFQFRLAYYLFGLMLGGFFVVYFLGAKADAKGVEFCYLPNCRALKDMRSKSFYYSEIAKETLKEGWVTIEDVKKSMEFGDIDFSKSNIPSKNGKIYIIEGKTSHNEVIILTVANSTTKATLETIEKK